MLTRIGDVVTGAGWTEVSAHAIDRFVERFDPEEHNPSGRLAKIGAEARYFGDVPGGSAYLHDDYPEALFIVRGRPAILVSVLDRPMMASKAIDAAPPAASSEPDEIQRIVDKRLEDVTSDLGEPRSVVLARRKRRTQRWLTESMKAHEERLASMKPSDVIPWERVSSDVSTWAQRFFFFEHFPAVMLLADCLFRKPKLLIRLGAESLWEAQGFLFEIRLREDFETKQLMQCLVRVVPPEGA